MSVTIRSVPAAQDPALLPLFLKLGGRHVLVVGGGEVAAHKVAGLLEAGARVKVVAKEANAALARLAHDGRIELVERAFKETDADGAWLVYAATSDPAAQAALAGAADARLQFCVAVDDPPNASAYSGSVVRRAPFIIAISSSGEVPALTRLVRAVVEEVLPGDRWIAEARRLRSKWRADGTPAKDRFGELVREIARRRP